MRKLLQHLRKRQDSLRSNRVIKTLILVIDPDPEVRKSAETILENDKYWVEAVSNLESALLSHTEKKVEIILINCELNRQDDFAIPKIKNDFPDTKIIAMINNYETDTIRDTIIAGADDYIRKPFSSDDLRFIIESLLDECFKSNKRAIEQV